MKGGITVTGRLLGNLAVTYVDAIRSGNIPCLENAVLALSQIENSAAVEQSHALYRQLLGERVVLHTETQEELSSVHEGCLKEALQLFLDRSFKDDNQRFQEDLMERIKEEYEGKCRENEQISENHCTALLVQLEDSMRPQEFYMKPGGYNHYRKDLDDFVELYRQAPGKGIKAEQVLEEYLKEKNNLGKTILMADRNLSEQQRCLAEERTRAELERHKAQAAREQQRVMERRLEDMARARRENERQLLEKMERDRNAALKEHQRVLDQKLREQNALLTEGYNERARRLEGEIARLRREVNQSRRPSGGGGGCIIS
ncbi:hypothetical protein MATL_G00226540 [Megalops atlanticus]|uniref:Guanylate-binding protein/Atlastin C-terminal domain-containing protein n=1 Tax=Megalops atlanticus TaxID=7932 RepID=A0A9D3T3D7_MEGAT|nr:hypothetical protein MATL_G00226540 [Megalops atlanticus]